MNNVRSFLTKTHWFLEEPGIQKTMQHFEDEVLEGYVLGTLSPVQAEELEEHLLICEGCRERVDSMSDFVQSISAAALVVRQTEFPAAIRVRTAGAHVSSGF